ncbi:MAG: hypothetical protein ACLT63_10015 [Bacteroides xylanisolvens]
MSQSNIPVTGIELFGPEDYKYIFYAPEKVEIKCYEEEFECKVTFKSAQDELLLDFGKNQEELARLDDFVSKGLRIKGARLREVHIMGYTLLRKVSLVIINIWRNVVLIRFLIMY